MSEPENIVLILLRQIREEMATKNKLSALEGTLKNDIAGVRSDVKSLRADVASDLMTIEQRLSERIAHLNRAVMEYHSAPRGRASGNSSS